VLYSPITLNAVVVIAEEAEMLIPQLRSQESPPKVHLLTYSAPVTKKMIPFGGLRYYAVPALQSEHVIPQRLTIELGIFAGRLYVEYEECAPLVEYIDHASMIWSSDATTRGTISFILEWLSLRRRGQDIMHTPLGYVCQGRPLSVEHAFFVNNRSVNSGVIESIRTDGAVTEKPEDEADDEDEKWYDVEESLRHVGSS
jgi:hypothetical protein